MIEWTHKVVVVVGVGGVCCCCCNKQQHEDSKNGTKTQRDPLTPKRSNMYRLWLKTVVGSFEPT